MTRYQETQPIMPKALLWMIRLLLLAIAALFAVTYYQREFLESPIQEHGMASEWGLVLCALIALVAWYLSRIRITIEVADERLNLSLGAVGKRTFKLEDIESVEDYQGSPARDFLGYGYRLGLKQIGYIGRAKHALLLKINHQDRPIVVTTERPEQLRQALLGD